MSAPGVHGLKCWPPCWENTNDGVKTLEIRRNDRGYRVGDILVLHEFDPETQSYSGRSCRRLITHVLEGGPLGLQDGYVCLSLRDPGRHAVSEGVLADAEAFGLLVDHLFNRLNPLDDDRSASETSWDALDGAVEFIEAQPCSCPSAERDDIAGEECARCAALGRVADTAW